MVFAINYLESQGKRRLPSQPKVNPKNVSTMTFRSGMEIEGPKPIVPKDIEKKLEKERISKATPKVISNFSIKVNTNPLPFPSRLEKPKRQNK